MEQASGFECEVCGEWFDGSPDDIWMGSEPGMGICRPCALNEASAMLNSEVVA